MNKLLARPTANMVLAKSLIVFELCSRRSFVKTFMPLPEPFSVYTNMALMAHHHRLLVTVYPVNPGTTRLLDNNNNDDGKFAATQWVEGSE